jgi:hypothetical protein
VNSFFSIVLAKAARRVCKDLWVSDMVMVSMEAVPTYPSEQFCTL